MRWRRGERCGDEVEEGKGREEGRGKGERGGRERGG